MSFLSSSLRMARLTFFRSCPGLVICTRGRRVHPCVSARAHAQRSPDPETQQRHDPHAPVHRRTMPFLVTRCGVLETPGIVPNCPLGLCGKLGKQSTREEDLSEWEA